MADHCNECRFFERNPAAGTSSALYFGARDARDGKGLCRRHAPRPTTPIMPQWPHVHAADWCGDFQSLPQNWVA